MSKRRRTTIVTPRENGSVSPQVSRSSRERVAERGGELPCSCKLPAGVSSHALQPVNMDVCAAIQMHFSPLTDVLARFEVEMRSRRRSLKHSFSRGGDAR